MGAFVSALNVLRSMRMCSMVPFGGGGAVAEVADGSRGAPRGPWWDD